MASIIILPPPVRCKEIFGSSYHYFILQKLFNYSRNESYFTKEEKYLQFGESLGENCQTKIFHILAQNSNTPYLVTPVAPRNSNLQRLQHLALQLVWTCPQEFAHTERQYH